MVEAHQKTKVGVDSKATSSASKQQWRKASLYLAPVEPLVASSIATEATKPSPPLVPKDVRQKA